MALHGFTQLFFYQPVKKSGNPISVSPESSFAYLESVSTKRQNQPSALLDGFFSTLDSENKKALPYLNAMPVYAGLGYGILTLTFPWMRRIKRINAAMSPLS